MDILTAALALLLGALMVAWMAATHDLIWKWIKKQVKSLFHLVSALLQIVVKKVWTWLTSWLK